MILRASYQHVALIYINTSDLYLSTHFICGTLHKINFSSFPGLSPYRLSVCGIRAS